MDYAIFSSMMPAWLGAMIGAMVGVVLIFALFVLVAVYVYFSFAWMTIGKKLKYKRPWLAWIPFANFSMILQIGGFGWGWVFLLLIPVLGWIAFAVLMIISHWRIYEKRKYPGWLSLIPLAGSVPFIGWLTGIASLIILGLVAWKDR
jgi:hypothetical protein